VSDKVTDLVTRRLGIVEPFSGAVAETRVHESCRLLDHRFDPLHRRYTGPAQPRGLQDTGPLLKLGADLLGLVRRQRLLPNRLAAFSAVKPRPWRDRP
jgi:hypothetical protein